jgi:hypothetical protein
LKTISETKQELPYKTKMEKSVQAILVLGNTFLSENVIHKKTI